jgi:hypothetical protein
MRRPLPLPVLLALALAACGKEAAEPPAPAAPLQGGGWIGDPVDPTLPGGTVVALAFFKPG